MNQDPFFNLLDERWIACYMRDGSHETFGIRVALARADKIFRIEDELPANSVGIFRLLLAIVGAALSQQARESGKDFTIDEKLWAKLLKSPKTIEKELRTYFKEYADKFDLFGEKPFFQEPGLLAKTKADKLKGVAELRADLPAGTAIAHFNHAYDGGFAMTPAECAAGLCAIPAFASSGGRGIFPSINGVPPTYAMPRTESLWESLIIALPKGAIAGDDAPAWEGKAPTKKSTIGLLEGLTWQARKAGLKLDEDGLIREVAFEMGRKADAVKKGDVRWSDPMACANWTPSRPMGSGRVTTLFTHAAFDLIPKGLLARSTHDLMKGIDFIGMANDGKAKNFAFVELFLGSSLLQHLEDQELLADLTTAWAEVRANTLSSSNPKWGIEQWELERRVKDSFLGLCHQLAGIEDDAKQAETLEAWQKNLRRSTVDKIKLRREPSRYDPSRVEVAAIPRAAGPKEDKTSVGKLFIEILEAGGWSQGLVKRAYLDANSPDRALAYEEINRLHREKLQAKIRVTREARKAAREEGSGEGDDFMSPKEVESEQKLIARRHVSWIVARLYAIHPHHSKEGLSIGKAMHRILIAQSKKSDKSFFKLLKEDPIALAFQRALVSDLGSLAEELGRVCAAFPKKDPLHRPQNAAPPFTIDFAKLYDDLSSWNNPNEEIAKTWHQDLHRSLKQTTQEPAQQSA